MTVRAKFLVDMEFHWLSDERLKSARVFRRFSAKSGDAERGLSSILAP